MHGCQEKHKEDCMNYLYLILSLFWTVGVPVLIIVWLGALTLGLRELYNTVKAFKDVQ